MRNFDVPYPLLLLARTARRCSPSPAPSRRSAIPSFVVLDDEGRVAAEHPGRAAVSTDAGRGDRGRGRGVRGWVTGSREQAASGSLLLAVPVALVAGLVSFFSPCVIPLLPGYLSYATGLSGADLEDARRSRMVAGSVLFVLGFTVVFVILGTLSGALGAWLVDLAARADRRARDRHDRARPGVRRAGAAAPARLAGAQGAGGRPGRGAAARLPVRARLDALHRPDARRDHDPLHQRGDGRPRRAARRRSTRSGWGCRSSRPGSPTVGRSAPSGSYAATRSG